MSLALLQRHPDLTSTVFDIENVCAEGRRIAAEHSLQARITYLAGDILAGGLPAGFDLVLACDLGIYSEALFAGVYASLGGNGRFAVADQLPATEDDLADRQVVWGFTASLTRPAAEPMTVDRLRALLAGCRFEVGFEADLLEGYRLIEARAR